jgi:AAA domain, putative AbiEii toxin, Type IV TA system
MGGGFAAGIENALGSCTRYGGNDLGALHMLLTSALIRKFKSIDDSGIVRFEPDVTCLVGRNESGKTAFLEALARANPVADDPRRFDELRDYPRALRAAERELIPDTVPVSAGFELSDGDVEALWAEFGPGVVSSREVRLERLYSGRRRLIVQQDDAARARGVGGELVAFLMERLPRSLYFSHYSVLPGRVSIPRLQRLPSSQLTAGERTARSLLRLAAVTRPEDFAESAYEQRKAALEAAAHRISDEVFRYWSQGRDLAVELDVDFRAAAAGASPGGFAGPGPFLDIRIRDQRHGVTMNFGERSEGFVWFFSFVAAFSQVRDADQVILLLDEPGLGLHAAAQADLLRYIREQLAPRHQVVYTTHSPFMVDPGALRCVRTVEDLDDQGTKVGVPDRATRRETLAPLQAALATEVAGRLGAGPDTLLVPGPADLLYLEVISGYLNDAGKQGLDARWTVIPSGGLHALPTLAALLGAPLEAAVLLGVGDGHPEVTELVRDGLLLPQRLVPLTELAGGSEAGLEDLFDEGFYLELLGWCGMDSPRAAELPGGDGALVRRIEHAIGHPVDRYRPARFLLVNQANLLPGLGRATINRFARLFERLNQLEPPGTS